MLSDKEDKIRCLVKINVLATLSLGKHTIEQLYVSKACDHVYSVMFNGKSNPAALFQHDYNILLNVN